MIKLDLCDPDHWFFKCDNLRTINSFVNVLCCMKSPNLFVFLSPSNLRSTKQAELTKVGSLQLGNTYEVKNYIQAVLRLHGSCLENMRPLTVLC